MEQSEFLKLAREWKKQHAEWELYCDIMTEAVEALYTQFGELPAKERMHWVGKYGNSAISMWKEYGVRKCKVETAYLNEQMKLVNEWPAGCGMLCFRTSTNLSAHLRDDASYLQCSKCGRKSYGGDCVNSRCGMLSPSGERCNGLLLGRNTNTP